MTPLGLVYAPAEKHFLPRSRVALKMWTSSCSVRLVCVVILAAAVLVSPSEVVAVDTYVPVIGLSCCTKVSRGRIRDTVKLCYEQKPRVDCNRHAFRIITEGDKEWCVDPAALWLRRKIRQGKLQCSPELS